jgi:hypothetical protein
MLPTIEAGLKQAGIRTECVVGEYAKPISGGKYYD